MTPRPRSSVALLGAVVVGGAAGVTARAAVVIPLEAATSLVAQVVGTTAVNLVGSLLLGVVVGRLGSSRPVLRAFLGPGVLGGFTTYSGFAVQSVQLGGAAPVVGMLAVVVSVGAGVAAAGVGLRLGGRREAP